MLAAATAGAPLVACGAGEAFGCCRVAAAARLLGVGTVVPCELAATLLLLLLLRGPRALTGGTEVSVAEVEGDAEDDTSAVAVGGTRVGAACRQAAGRGGEGEEAGRQARGGAKGYSAKLPA